MKKLLCALLVCVLSFSLCGCTILDVIGFVDDVVSESEMETLETTSPKSTVTPEKNTINRCVVTIKEARLSAGYDEEPVLIVTYTFANTSDELKSFGYTVSAQVFQDGIECRTGYPKRGEISDNRGITLDVKPNATVTVEQAYELKNSSSVVTVELRPWASSDAEPSAAKTFTLDQLQ